MHSQKSPGAKRINTFFEVENDLELSSKKMKIVPFSIQMVKAKDSLSLYAESITEQNLNPIILPRVTPHLRKVLLKLRTSSNYSDNDRDSSSLMKNNNEDIQSLIAMGIQINFLCASLINSQQTIAKLF